MIINQTVNNHDVLLKVVDNLLSEADLNRADLKGKAPFCSESVQLSENFYFDGIQKFMLELDN